MSNKKPELNIGAFDYVVLAIILFISIFVGVYHGYKHVFTRLLGKLIHRNQVSDEIEMKSSEEDENTENRVSSYLTGNSSMHWFPVSFSLLATFFSTNSVLGHPAEVYQYGVQILIIGFGHAVAPLFGAFLFGPFFDKLGILSMFEYIQMRYDGSQSIRLIAMACYVARNFVSSAIYVLGPSSALNLFMKLDQSVSIILVSAIGTFYTCIGGIKAVIWTDLFQAMIMIVSLLVVLITGIVDVGGVSNLFEINQKGGRINLFDFDPDPFKRQTFWPLFIGGAVYFTLPYCFDQQMLQRFKATKTKKQAKLAIALNSPGCILVVGLCAACGLVVYSYFAQCDPIQTGEINNPNQYISLYILEKFHDVPGMCGIFLGAIFCSSLSSLSSTLNSLAAILWQDFFKRFAYFRSFTDSQGLTANKLIVLVSGVVIAGLTFLMSLVGSNLVQISNTFNGTFNGPIVGLFILSCMFSCVTKAGAITGFLFGLIMSFWVNLGAILVEPKYPRLDVSIEACINETKYFNTSTSPIFSYRPEELTGFDRFYALSFNWYTTYGMLNTILAGLLISLVSGGIYNKVDKELLVCDLSKCIKKK